MDFHGSATTCRVCTCLVEPCWFYCLFCFYSIVAFHIQKVVLFENFCSLPKVWGRRIELLQWEGTSGVTVPPTQCESSQLDCSRPCPVVFWQSPMMKVPQPLWALLSVWPPSWQIVFLIFNQNFTCCFLSSASCYITACLWEEYTSAFSALSAQALHHKWEGVLVPHTDMVKRATFKSVKVE